MLTNEQLLRRLSKLCRAARQIDVGVVLLLIEVEDRRLHLEAACPSLHDFCRRHLRWSEGTTHRRVEAARVARRCPSIIGHIRSGAITLSALAQVRAHIDDTNVGEWVPRLAGKSRRQIEAILADVAPKADVPSLIRPLPPPRARRGESPATPMNYDRGSAPTADAAPAEDYTRAQGTVASTARSDDAPTAAVAPSFTSLPAPARPARLEPLGEQRWKIQLMARRGLHDKVERAQSLMRHRNPSGDLVVVFEAALDALLARLERPRRPPPLSARRPSRSHAHTTGESHAPSESPAVGESPTTSDSPSVVAETSSSTATPTPAAAATAANPLPDAPVPKGHAAQRASGAAVDGRVSMKRRAGAVSLATRRAVFARDGERCTFVSADGHRCPATDRLEVDHILARALGGSGKLANLRVRCRAHNKLQAEKDFGRAHVERRIQERKLARTTSTVEARARGRAGGERRDARDVPSQDCDASEHRDAPDGEANSA